MAIRAVIGIINGLRHNSGRKLAKIGKYKAAGSYTVAKVSCYTITGTKDYHQHNLEYVYKVGDRLYYVTYQIKLNLLDSAPKKTISSGWLRKFFKQDKINERELLNLSDMLFVYYNPKHPKQALCKQEAFIAPDAWKRKRTPRKNPYRLIDADWTQPVDLRNL